MLPIRTSIRPWRTPYTNYALIIANAVFFLLTYHPHINPMTGMQESLRSVTETFMLVPTRPEPWQFVTYAFLHGSLLHIIGNMYFLYLFGNNVNDKLGHIGYLCFYLAGAVFSGIGHSLMSMNPVLGASGAVAAVTGAYLVLFPKTLITVVYWFFFIGITDLPALYFIAFKMIFWDNIFERRMPNVAYGAHLSGYAFGIASMIIMLATGLLSTTSFDLWNMIKQWNRRRRYRDTVASGSDPFTGRTHAKQVKVKEVKKSPQQKKKDAKSQQLRYDIAQWITQRNVPSAADIYIKLMEIDNTQILPRQQLLDIANQLASDNKSEQAALAYEQFLENYRNYEYTEQVELMLGVLYSRYLGKHELAEKHLKIAQKKLSDKGQLKMCADELDRLKLQ